MNKFFDYLWKGIIVVLMIYLIIGCLYSYEANSMCKKECEIQGTVFHKLLPNGDWFSVKDMCVCYFENKEEVRFILDD